MMLPMRLLTSHTSMCILLRVFLESHQFSVVLIADQARVRRPTQELARQGGVGRARGGSLEVSQVGAGPDLAALGEDEGGLEMSPEGEALR